MSTFSTEAQRPADTGDRTAHWAFAVLRVVATAHLVAIFAQPVLAGMFLSGSYDMLQLHITNAIVVLALSATQLVVAIAVWWRGGLRWPTVVSAGLSLGEVTQFQLGRAFDLQVHLPLGVFLIVTTSISVVALWRPHTLGAPEAKP